MDKTIAYKAWSVTVSGGEYEADCALRDAEQAESEWLYEETERMYGRDPWADDEVSPAERRMACAGIQKYLADIREWERAK